MAGIGILSIERASVFANPWRILQFKTENSHITPTHIPICSHLPLPGWEGVLVQSRGFENKTQRNGMELHGGSGRDYSI